MFAECLVLPKHTSRRLATAVNLNAIEGSIHSFNPTNVLKNAFSV